MQVDAEDLVAALRAEGLRITRARRAVCQVIADRHHDHLTTTEVHEAAVRVAGQPVDPSTVYRTMEVLERLGIARHVHLGHGPGVIHLAGGEQHQHLTCDECGATIDIPVELLEPLFAKLTAMYGFTATPSHFALGGLCRECEHSRNVS